MSVSFKAIKGRRARYRVAVDGVDAGLEVCRNDAAEPGIRWQLWDDADEIGHPAGESATRKGLIPRIIKAVRVAAANN